MSTTPMMVITQGKPMVSAMDPPIDGPVSITPRLVWRPHFASQTHIERMLITLMFPDVFDHH